MRLVIITSRFPYPLDKGDKLRAYNQLKYLAKKHEVLLICLSDKTIKKDHLEHIKQYCEVRIFKISRLSILFNLFLGIFSRKPFQVHYFYNHTIKNNIERLIESFKPNHIYAQLIRTTEYVKDLYSIPKTLDYMDAFSKGMERRLLTENILLKTLINIEHQRLLNYENIIFDYFDNSSIISEQDRNSIHHKDKLDIEIVKNGVDTEYFAPQFQAQKIFDIAFIGNMNYPPNINAACFIVHEILPLLPNNIKVVFAGAQPHQKVKQLSSRQVNVLGWVDDIRDIYAQSKLFVAPMMIGTGLQNKLLEAMSMEIPCITTTLANNALGAKPNEEVIIGNSANEIAIQISKLLEDLILAKQIAKNGHDFVLSNYSWQVQNEILNQILLKKTTTSD